ncbi:hypothetical protein V8E51_007559, partial [Hyaloscypha variabilis]
FPTPHVILASSKIYLHSIKIDCLDYTSESPLILSYIVIFPLTMSGIGEAAAVAGGLQAFFGLAELVFNGASILAEIRANMKDGPGSIREEEAKIQNVLEMIAKIESVQADNSLVKAFTGPLQQDALFLKGKLKGLSIGAGDGMLVRLGKSIKRKCKEKDVAEVEKRLERKMAIVNTCQGAITNAMIKDIHSLIIPQEMVRCPRLLRTRCNFSICISKRNSLTCSQISAKSNLQMKLARSKVLAVRSIDNSLFIGRAVLMEFLQSKLEVDGVHTRSVLCGLPSAGKSSAAREYARQYEMRFPNAAVLVVDAESYSSFQRSLRESGIPRSGNIFPSAEDIHDELSSRSTARWLMIVENANDWDLLFGPNGISQKIPTSSDGCVLFITRDKYVARGLASKTNIATIDGLDKSEAEELLLSGIGIPKPANEEAASMNELLRLLAYQPCLICCAASFISANSMSIRTYVQEYCKGQNSTTEQLCNSQDLTQPQFPTCGSRSNLASWYDDMIGLFEKIRRSQPHAADLLRFMACLAIERIPKALLSSKPLPTLEIDISKALRALTRYCLITGDEDYQLFRVPLMVRLATRRWLKEHRSLDIWVNAAFCSVYQRFPEVNCEKETLELCNAYFVHAEEVLRLKEPFRERLDNEATLAIQCSEYLRMKGHFSRAVEYATEANRWSQNRFGPTGEKTLACLGKLAALLRDQGIFIKAREIDERILDQRIRVQGQKHPSTMAAMNGLASAFHGLGWYKKAAKMHNYVFRVRKAILGPRNPETLASMANLCRSLASLEILGPAEKIAKKVVLIKSELYGPEHPSTIISMQTLGGIFRRRGNYSKAEHLFKIVLKARKETQNDDMHPEVLLAMGNIVGVLEDRGKFQEAKTLAEEVLSASTKRLGSKHPNTIRHANNLSEILIHLKDFDEAEKLKRQVLRDRKKILGPSHPDTLRTEDGLKYLLGMKYPEWQHSPMILLLAA